MHRPTIRRLCPRIEGASGGTDGSDRMSRIDMAQRLAKLEAARSPRPFVLIAATRRGAGGLAHPLPENHCLWPLKELGGTLAAPRFIGSTLAPRPLAAPG